MGKVDLLSKKTVNSSETKKNKKFDNLAKNVIIEEDFIASSDKEKQL